MDVDHLKKSEESWDSPACKSYIWVYVWPFYCIIVIVFTEFNQRTPIHKCVVYSEKSWSSQSQHPSSYMRICVYSTAVSHIIHTKYMEQPENPENPELKFPRVAEHSECSESPRSSCSLRDTLVWMVRSSDCSQSFQTTELVSWCCLSTS